MKRPERYRRLGALRVDRIAIVVPLQNLQLGLPNIRVGDIKNRQIGEVVVHSDREILLQYTGRTRKCEFHSRTISVGDALVRLRVQSKVVPGAFRAFDSLGSGERT